MFCHSCGAQIPDGSTFCASCGSAQQQAAPQAAPQQPYAAPQQPYAAPQQPYAAPQQPYAAPQQPYAAPQQPYAAPQQPYAAPQQPYAAPQQPYGAPQQPYGAPQQPYAAPKGANGFNNFMNSLQFHDIMVKFGFFIAAGVFALLGILLFTGCQYGSVSYGWGSFGGSVRIADGLYAANGFTCFMDIIFGILALAFGVAQVFFWAQFKKNNLGFLPMLGTQKTFKLFNLITSVYAGLTAVYFLVQGICVASAGMSFFAPWLGLVTLLLAVAYYIFTAMYYKNNAGKIQ